MRLFKNPLTLAHYLVSLYLKPGDTAVDATVGNGHDTLFLAQQVGTEGTVYAFDTQPLAVYRATERLKEHGVAARVYFINDGHERMQHYVPPPVQAVMFNLGYLPGAGRRFATRPETTVPALDQAVRLLDKRGIITIVIYTGHPGAQEEQETVENWAALLPQTEWDVVRFTFPNRRNNPPYLLAVLPVTAEQLLSEAGKIEEKPSGCNETATGLEREIAVVSSELSASGESSAHQEGEDSQCC